MTIRVTITKPNVFNSYGIALTVGQTYSLDDDFALSLITQLKATDTDSSMVSPGVGLGVAPDIVYVNAAAIAAPTAQMLASTNIIYALDVSPFTQYQSNSTSLIQRGPFTRNAAGTIDGLATDTTRNSIFQPSSLYKFWIPGRQFIGSGNAKDASGNSADAALMAGLSDAAAWANPGYMTSVAAVNGGFAVPNAKITFDLSTQSVIFSVRVKMAAPVGSTSVFGCGDGSSNQGFYLSMRAASGSVSKMRPVLNTSGGVVSGLADSTATFGETAATDHVVTLAIDGISKAVYLWCDGTLSNTYTSAFTGGTTVASGFGFGLAPGNAGATAAVLSCNDAHFLVMTGALPTNMNTVARMCYVPGLAIRDADLQF